MPFDDGRVYSLPWQSGFTGIAYNPKSTGGEKIETIEQLLTDPKLKGKVTLLTEMRDTVGLDDARRWARTRPTSPTTTSTPPSRRSRRPSTPARSRSFTGNDYGKGLSSGDIAACMAWTGDVVQLQADNPGLGYVLPDNGHMALVGQLPDPEHGAAQEERRDH